MILRILTFIFLFLNFVLPKAGTKIGIFPLYISAMLAILIYLPLTFYLTLKNFRQREERLTLIYYASFLIVFLADFLLEGQLPPYSNIPDIYAPYFIALSSPFLIFTAKYLNIKPAHFKIIILCSFFLLSLYGLVQKIFGDINTIIPGVTYNYAEAVKLNPHSTLDLWAKHNFIPELQYLKLSSTYQNGNLFGVNYILLSWFALYFLRSGKGLLMKILYYSSFLLYVFICFLTASETVYFGLFVSLLLIFTITILDIKNSSGPHKGIKIITLILVPIILFIISLFIINDVKLFHSLIVTKLLARNLLSNERILYFIKYIQYLIEQKGILQFLFGCFFNNPNNSGGYEITLVYIFVNSGIIFAFIFIFYILTFLKKLKLSVYNIGIFSYIAASFIDGGFWLPPTAFSFFMLIGISLYILQKRMTEDDGITSLP
jgi:hypothetical protein